MSTIYSTKQVIGGFHLKNCRHQFISEVILFSTFKRHLSAFRGMCVAPSPDSPPSSTPASTHKCAQNVILANKRGYTASGALVSPPDMFSLREYY